MTLLTILEYPDPRLRTIAKEVTTFGEDLKKFVALMFETMYQAKGIGLAASQVDHHYRVIVIDISDEKNDPICLINPKIIKSEGKTSYEEGCLSVPNFFEKVERAEKITVNYQSLEGSEYEMEADGLLAICIQHEMDHLIGKLFVDYLSTLKRNKFKKLLEKRLKNTDTEDFQDQAGRKAI